MRRFLLLTIVLAAAFVLLAAPVAAHEHREVGEYAIVFGWRVEPAYAGIYNGPELFITLHDTGEPVEGLDATLQLDVSLGGDSMPLTLYGVFNDPGHYTADLLPTRPGDYSFHLTGTIEDTEVDETFTSINGDFSAVEPMTDIAFPAAAEASADSADLQAQIDALQAQIDDLRAQIEALQSGS